MRRFVLPLALLLAAPAADAQVSFGLTAGLNAASTSSELEDFGVPDEDGVDKQPRLGLVAGAFADVALTPQLSLRPELVYSQKGETIAVDVSDDGFSFDGSQTSQIDYLELPLMLAYRFPIGQNGLAVGLEAGPTFAYKLRVGVSCSGDFEELCDDIEDNEDLGDSVRDIDFGAALGATVGAGPFDVGLRYTLGLATINDEDEPDAIEARNRVFSVAARYTFGG